jgi:hypothetical protein
VPNVPPVAQDDAFSTQRGLPVDLPVLANDTDPEGSPLSVTLLSQPAHGALELLPGGVVRYTPDAGFLGTDGFDYRVEDGHPHDPPLTADAHVTLHLTPDLVWESFLRNSAQRAPGSPLHGAPVEEGATTWRATRLIFHAGADVATTVGQASGGYASLPLPRIVMGGAAPDVVTVEAKGTLGGVGNAWIGVGLLPEPPADGSSLDLTAHGTLWVRVTSTGAWFLRRGAPPIIAQGMAPHFSATGWNSLRLEYDRTTRLAHLWINGVRVLEDFVVIQPLAGSELAGAGFQVFHPAGTASGAMTVDHFDLFYRHQPTAASRIVGDDFSPAGLPDRQAGQRLGRVWANEGDGRWNSHPSYTVQFDALGTASIGRAAGGSASLPLRVESIAPPEVVDDLFVEATVLFGDAADLTLGLFGVEEPYVPAFPSGVGPGLSPQQAAPELWWRIHRDGTWTLDSRQHPVAAGTIRELPTTTLVNLRLETRGVGYALFVAGHAHATGTLSEVPQVRSVGFEVHNATETEGTFRLDDFLAGVLSEASGDK